MKKKFLKVSLNLIRKYNPDLDDIKLDEIRYGLEGYYLTFTKMIVVFSLAIYLGIIKEALLLVIFYNVLRESAFGLHASKSWMCWISSLLLFDLFPVILKEIIIPFNIKLALSFIALVLIAMYAPADTKKAPLIYKKKRIRYKIISVVNCFILVGIALFLNNNIATLILGGIYIEIILILPITYKIFKLPYHNYLSYVPSYIIE